MKSSQGNRTNSFRKVLFCDSEVVAVGDLSIKRGHCTVRARVLKGRTQDDFDAPFY
jgi:hypothetical protein